MLLMVVIKSSARPPKVSVTIGMQEMPADLQFGRLKESFRWTPTSNVARGLGCLGDSQRLERGDYMGCRATVAPVGEEDFSWA